jgi:hypothetical protein
MHAWQLKTVVFLHWWLICVILFFYIKHRSKQFGRFFTIDQKGGKLSEIGRIIVPSSMKKLQSFIIFSTGTTQATGGEERRGEIESR